MSNTFQIKCLYLNAYDPEISYLLIEGCGSPLQLISNVKSHRAFTTLFPSWDFDSGVDLGLNIWCG